MVCTKIFYEGKNIMDNNEAVLENIVLEKKDTELIHRINRIIGQLEAIKKTIKSNEKKDCVKTIRLLKAANNAMKKFGEVYVKDHIQECLLNKETFDKDMEENLTDVISSAFSM